MISEVVVGVSGYSFVAYLEESLFESNRKAGEICQLSFNHPTLTSVLPPRGSGRCGSHAYPKEAYCFGHFLGVSGAPSVGINPVTGRSFPPVLACGNCYKSH